MRRSFHLPRTVWAAAGGEWTDRSSTWAACMHLDAQQPCAAATDVKLEGSHDFLCGFSKVKALTMNIFCSKSRNIVYRIVTGGYCHHYKYNIIIKKTFLKNRVAWIKTVSENSHKETKTWCVLSGHLFTINNKQLLILLKKRLLHLFLTLILTIKRFLFILLIMNWV